MRKEKGTTKSVVEHLETNDEVRKYFHLNLNFFILIFFCNKYFNR